MRLIRLGCLLALACLAARAASTTISVPGRPFDVAVSPDGQWLYASLVGGREARGGLVVLQRRGDTFHRAAYFGLPVPLTGMALSRDGRLLVAAASDRVVCFATDRLGHRRSDAVLQSIECRRGAGVIGVAIAPDDRHVFVAEERTASIDVLDLARLSRGGNALVGKIPVGRAPVAMVFSPDGRWLYSTSEVAAPSWGWPLTRRREARPGRGRIPDGAVVVIDAHKAAVDPAGSVVARVPADGSPVRLALSPDGRRLYVSARASNSLLVFNTPDLLHHSVPTPDRVAVGQSPVPVALVRDGALAVVGNSQRFGGANQDSTLTLVDTRRIGTTAAPVIGTWRCGAFPRNFCVAPDGRTLFLANFGSGSIQVIDVAKLP